MIYRLWPALAAALWFCAWGRAVETDLSELRRQATDFERRAAWDKACEVYERILGRDHQLPDIRDRYRLCLRHAACVHRLADATFQELYLHRDWALAVKVYGEVLDKLHSSYVDRERAAIDRLFVSGIDEFVTALDDPVFRAQFLAGVEPASIDAARQEFQNVRIAATADIAAATDGAMEVALRAKKSLGLKPAVTILELACGACAGLDEYTLFLSPAQLGAEYAALDGETGDIGLELAVNGGKATVAHIMPGSPAALAGLRAGDAIQEIDAEPTASQSTENLSAALAGSPGSEVRLQVVAAASRQSRTVVLRRQAQIVHTVATQVLDRQMGVGYCHITNFARGTAEELDQGIAQLKSQGVRALILDLRGNGGGMFQPAIATAERFLSAGVIVSLRGQLRDQNRTYRAGNLHPYAMPLLVLIDGETASSAEIVAGALKDNQRATLIGQPTYGKGSIQGVLPLEATSAGIRVSLARFFSPLGKTYEGNGVTPDWPVPAASLSMSDQSLEIALMQARRLSASMP